MKDLEDIPDNVKRDLKLIPVATVDDVLKHALVRQPEAIEWKDPKETVAVVAEVAKVDGSDDGIVTH